MNSLQRTLAAVRFEPHDRVPVLPQIFAHAARLAGEPLVGYLQDGETLARCQLAAQRHYGYDALFGIMDLGLETEALGSTLRYSEQIYPEVVRYLLDGPQPIDRLPQPDPQRDGRMPELLKALSIMRNEVQDGVVVLGFIQGPMTLATQLLGIERALYLATDEPEYFGGLLDYCVAVQERFGLAQIAAGAHVQVIIEPASSPVVVPPQFFRELLMPRLQRLTHTLKAAGTLGVWLHVAGDTRRTLPYYRDIGVDIANFDYEVSAEEAQAACPGLCVDGNVRTLAFVTGDADEVRRAADGLLERFRERGGFILSSGCEIPPEARPETIQALVEAAVAGG